MPARRMPTLALPVDTRSVVSFREYTGRTPLLTITASRPALLVTFTLPEHLEAGHVDFARQRGDWLITRMDLALDAPF